MKKNNNTGHLPPIVFKAKTVCWMTVILAIVIMVAVWWVVIKTPIIAAAVSVIVVWEVYGYFVHRNDRIVLTEQGIGLDHALCLLAPSERYNHIDIEWRNVKRIELTQHLRYLDIQVYTCSKTYVVDLSYYMVFATPFKRWNKAIKEYGHIPCSYHYPY